MGPILPILTRYEGQRFDFPQLQGRMRVASGLPPTRGQRNWGIREGRMRTAVRPHQQLNAFGSSRRYCATSLYDCGLNGLSLLKARIRDLALLNDKIYVMGLIAVKGSQAPERRLPHPVSLAGRSDMASPLRGLVPVIPCWRNPASLAGLTCPVE